MDSYCDESTPQVRINMDASVTGLCASNQAIKEFVRINFNTTELEAVRQFKEHGGHHAFNINVRELLSCIYATVVWGERWKAMSRNNKPVHVRFIIDNASAVSWTQKLGSRNALAQQIIRHLAAFQISFGLVFSAEHIHGTVNHFDNMIKMKLLSIWQLRIW